MMDPIRVTVSRGDLVESTHHVDAVIADGNGRVLLAAGSAETVTYWRSSAKPFQALPLVRHASAEAVDLTDEEIAVMCASHAAEPAHVRRVAQLLERFGLDESQLGCGAHPPLHEPSAQALWRAGDEPGRIHCNCSGKHAGMLIYASLLGADLASYLEPTHPVQQRILDVVSAFSGIPAAQIGLSVDGCGAPVFALPLAAMATAYARLAAPEGFVDDDTAKAARTIGSSMQAKPLFVSGTGRICTALMEALAPAVVAKGGAEGVYCVGLPAKGWGIAIKVQDGAARATGPVIVELLTALGIVHRGAGEALEEHRRPAVRNLSGLTVGRIEAALPAGFKDQLRRLGEVA